MASARAIDWITMSTRTLRRLIVGFVAGISAGWLGGLLHAPKNPPARSSAAGAAALPQDRFGTPPTAAAS